MVVALASRASAEITRVWLTHGGGSAERLTVNWQTAAAGDSVVEFGADENLGQKAGDTRPVTLHHVEIPLAKTALS
jgi:hypothetical protein